MGRSININLTIQQHQQLISIRRKQTDPRNEKCIAVIMAHEGKNCTTIAATLKRHVQTIYQWLHAWKNEGLDGLTRGKSTGRPSLRKEKLAPRLEQWLKHSPSHYGYQQEMWTIPLLQEQFTRETGESLSEDTVSRALKDLGFSYKRPRKSMPPNAPTKKEKRQKVLDIIGEINSEAKKGQLKIMFLDESHFSNEPYVIRGWYKRGKPFFPTDSYKKRDGVVVWGLRFGRREFLLQECETS